MWLGFAPAYCQWHTGTQVVKSCLAAWEGHPVIASDNNDGIVKFVDRLKALDDLSNFEVESLHLGQIVSEIVSHDRVIGQAGGDFDVCQFDSRFFSAAWFVRAMRILPAVPEAEGLTCFSLFKKLVKRSMLLTK